MSKYHELTLNLMRIVFGLMFWQHGAQKLLGWMGGFGGEPGNTAQLFSMMGLAGVLEFFGGLLILLGLFTRPVAFILAGEMAVAYFTAHGFNAFWPLVNRGETAVLYCFAFLFMAAMGGGRFSLDGKFRQKEAEEQAAPAPPSSAPPAPETGAPPPSE